MKKITLQCYECLYEVSGSSGEMMNKIIMWNHVKKAHPKSADRMLQHNQILPDTFYAHIYERSLPASPAMQHDNALA